MTETYLAEIGGLEADGTFNMAFRNRFAPPTPPADVLSAHWFRPAMDAIMEAAPGLTRRPYRWVSEREDGIWFVLHHPDMNAVLRISPLPPRLRDRHPFPEDAVWHQIRRPEARPFQGVYDPDKGPPPGFEGVATVRLTHVALVPEGHPSATGYILKRLDEGEAQGGD